MIDYRGISETDGTVAHLDSGGGDMAACIYDLQGYKVQWVNFTIGK